VAFRTGATAYLLPAAIAVVGGVTDLNATYVAGQKGTAVALLVEGGILIAAGVAADRLRRRIWDARTGRGTPPADAAPSPPDPTGADPMVAEMIELS
jgi:hypothetical protein